MHQWVSLLTTDLGPMRIRIQIRIRIHCFYDQKIFKFYFTYEICLSKNCNLFIPRLPNMKFHFSIYVGNFCRQNQSWSGSATLLLTITLTAFRRFAIRSGAKTMHSMHRAHKGVLTKRQKVSMSPSCPFVLWPSTPISTAKPTLLFHYTLPLFYTSRSQTNSFLRPSPPFRHCFTQPQHSSSQQLLYSATASLIRVPLNLYFTKPLLHSPQLPLATALLGHYFPQPQLHLTTASLNHSFTQPQPN
jgi:hypothetical protein